MANNLGKMTAQATLDARGFTGPLGQMERDTATRTQKMTGNWAALKRQMGIVKEQSVSLGQAMGSAGMFAAFETGKRLITAYLASLDRVIQRHERLGASADEGMRQLGEQAIAQRAAWRGIGDDIDTLTVRAGSFFSDTRFGRFLAGGNTANLMSDALSARMQFAPVAAADIKPPETPNAAGGAGLMLGMNTFGLVMQQAAEAARRYVVAQEAMTRQNESAMARTRQLADAARSTTQLLQIEMARITSAGLNSTQQAVLAGQQAQALLQTIPTGQLSGAARRGSAEAVTASNEGIARRLDGTPMDRMRQALELANQQRQQQIELGRQLLEAFRTGQFADVLGGGAA